MRNALITLVGKSQEKNQLGDQNVDGGYHQTRIERNNWWLCDSHSTV